MWFHMAYLLLPDHSHQFVVHPVHDHCHHFVLAPCPAADQIKVKRRQQLLQAGKLARQRAAERKLREARQRERQLRMEDEMFVQVKPAADWTGLLGRPYTASQPASLSFSPAGSCRQSAALAAMPHRLRGG
jgi:LmbE family N-acetylglucosaminyl deacetylase